MKNFFSIGEVSRLFHVKISTLRYYDEIGLLKPAYKDKQNNYRYYSTEQFERLDTIKYLRALGLPINKLLDFYNSHNADTLIQLLKNQKTEIDRKKRELELIEKKITRRLNKIEDAVNKPLDKITKIKLPELRVAYLQHEYILGHDIEHSLTELRNDLTIKEDIFLGKIGLSISVSNLKAHKFDRYSSIFMILEDEHDLPPSVITLPSNEYLQIRFKGSHKEAKQYYKKLLTYMKKHHLELAADSIEITLIDYGVTNNPDHYVTEIMLPIK
ncbi:MULTISPECIES: MerR family transcriptional regulator [Bacillus]|uniref:MerR family transcriptional regulator n=1 Tax=Bacillus TaxID=1386 RepID=UPI000652C4E7|nr:MULTISPECIES: MerR family transcriptional regulator [Bacillus]ALV03362.1 GntR family transcriptional regulator [Bacillus amyloliquefaciens]AMR52381.1 GntR family transcriptional regulator [Bacillus amyloliquefaciens]AOU02970.1 MerR family transcriptional regulator [Bacillus velezensis]ASB55382.1 putative HTH-type transcriptional regulator YdfL [Bacillus velezensis]AYV17683.1 MerR family transcriptional regulator [Bacillus velezensis]